MTAPTGTTGRWTMKRIAVEREYEIADVPDLQDLGTARRMVIRPRKVTIHQVYGTNLVSGATIEGRQVRRDGELAGGRMILAGVSTNRWGYSSAPPPWLNEILDAEGLEWQSGG
jgi:hypothetical protein